MRTITQLELNSVCVRTFTNNLAAYRFLLNQMPKGVNVHIPSYATVNRAVQEAGQFINLPTPLGIYVIKKVHLFRKEF